jgi:hypothetical protein
MTSALPLSPRTEPVHLGRHFVWGIPSEEVYAEIEHAFARLTRRICPSVLYDNAEERRNREALNEYYNRLRTTQR